MVATTALSLEFWSNKTGVGVPGVRVTLVDGQGQEQVAESDGGGRVQVDGLVGSFVRLMAARQGRQELALMLDTGTPQSVGGCD